MSFQIILGLVFIWTDVFSSSEFSRIRRNSNFTYKGPNITSSVKYNTNISQILPKTKVLPLLGEYLPGGKIRIADLPDRYQLFPGTNEFSRIVANNKNVYVVSGQQKHGYLYDPWTIGEVLGYLYEVDEFGESGPPGGSFTIELMGKKKPKKVLDVPKKRSITGGKMAVLEFRKRNID